MCGKTLGVLFAGMAALGVRADVLVDAENFILRQQWPWSGKVAAEFLVSGSVTAPGATAQLKAYDGTTFICDIPNAAASGDTTITSVGKKRLYIDPMRVPELKTRGIIKNFRLGIEYVDGKVDYTDPGILYVVFDLAGSDAPLVLTESEITGGSTAREGTGSYGSWKRKYWAAGADTLAWTGVNENDAYKTTKLVLRHIPAQTFMMGSPDDEPGRLPNANYNDSANQVKNYGLEDRHNVTLSDYYIGVFELTQKQWDLLGVTSEFLSGKGDAFPANNITYVDIRGAEKPYNSITEKSFMGLLAAKVGADWGVDLPSEAQWEAACRAGTTTGLYDGTDLPSGLTYYTLGGHSNMKDISYDPLARLAVFFHGNTVGSTLKVGTKLPNNYGLYDMLGNAGEICLDRIVPNTGLGSADATDPVYTTSGDARAMRGGTSDNWSSYNYGIAPYRSAARGSITYNSKARQFGFRVAMKPIAQP